MSLLGRPICLATSTVARTDASLTVRDGHCANGLWPSATRGILRCWSSGRWRCVLQHLLLGCHVLVRSDNTSAFAYINRQGGVRSKPLNSLATEIHFWALPRFESLRAAHLPGYLNFGADLCLGAISVLGSGFSTPGVGCTNWAYDQAQAKPVVTLRPPR